MNRRPVVAAEGPGVAGARRRGWAVLFDRDGQSLTEYSLILGLIAIVSLVAIFALGGELKNLHEFYSDAVDSACNTIFGT